MTDMKDLNSTLSDISDQLQHAVRDAIEGWAKEGRGQIRSAVGAPDASAIGGAFVAGTILGAVVGIVLALMLAPKSGPELREEIAERARRVNGAGQEPAPTIG